MPDRPSASLVIPPLPAQANPHYVRALSNLAQESEVQVCEDVYAQNGTKLLARGARVTPALYEQVINHRLRNPLESCLSNVETTETPSLRRIAEQALDECRLLRAFCDWSQGRVNPLGMLDHLQLSPQARTLLVVHEHRSPGAQLHHLRVALIAMGIANAWRYNDPRLLANIAVAALFHDIGELYIDPEMGKSGREISAREWMAFSAHPIIGAALAREVAKLDNPAQAAILEHHERVDGFGYPRGRRQQDVSTGGQILGLADTIAALMKRERPCQHVDVALKIMPGEFDPALVSLICAVLENMPADTAGAANAGDDMPDEIHQVFARIAATQDIHASWQSRSFSPDARAAIDDVFERFIGVQKAFASTGMDGFEAIVPMLSPDELVEARNEIRCVLDEILWRLTRISRELALRCMKLPEAEAQALMLMADTLAGRVTPGS